MTVSPPSLKPGRTRALLLLLLVFLLGAASGVGGGLLFLRSLAHRAWAGELGENSPVELVANGLEHQVSAELELTPEERQAVQKELALTVGQFRELRVKMRSDIRAIVEDTLTRVETKIPEGKRARLRERAGARLRPWGLMQ
ncbi:MAG: hypothetical protein OJI67_13205 [Prosthecobacter sp.]|nr:hypothetical protein [Prosthecobacter sp.]